MASPPEMKPIFLVLGKKGVGKSALINSLVGGVKFREVGPTDPISGTDIKDAESDGITFFEIPGSTDFTPNSTLMPDRGTNSMVLFCLRMDERLEDDDRRLMRALHNRDEMIWNRAIFVLTYANRVEESQYDRYLHDWEKALTTEMNKLGVKVNIPKALAGERGTAALRNHHDWCRDLITICAASFQLPLGNVVQELDKKRQAREEQPRRCLQRIVYLVKASKYPVKGFISGLVSGITIAGALEYYIGIGGIVFIVLVVIVAVLGGIMESLCKRL